MMERFAKGVIRHSKAIVIVWIIILLASAPFAYLALTSDNVLTYSYQIHDGSESAKGYEILRDTDLFDYKSLDYVIIVEYQERSQSGGVQAVADGLNERLKAQFSDNYSLTLLPIQGNEHKGKGFMIVNIPSDVSATQFTKNIRGMITDIRNTSGVNIGNTYVTGAAALTYDLSQSSLNDVKKIDPFAVILVLILIGLFFSSIVAAGVPPVTIGIAFSLTLMLIYVLSCMSIGVFFVTPTIALVSMLGAGCDYCIFVIARYKEERKAGKEKEDALTEAIRWAGESVLISGLCVIICFGMMCICTYQFMSVLGIVLAFGILVALLAAVTFIPAVINLIGDKIFYPSKIEAEKESIFSGISDFGRRYFGHSAKFSMKWAWAILIAAIVITVPLTYVAANEKTSFDLVQVTPDSESKTGVEILEDTNIASSKYGGIIAPVYEVIELKNTIANPEAKAFDKDGKERSALVWSSDKDAKNITYSTFYATYSALTFYKAQGLAKDIISHREIKKNTGIMIGAVSSEALLEYAAELMIEHKVEKRTDWDKYKAEAYAFEYIEKHPEYADNPVVKAAKEIYNNFPDFKTRCSVYDYEVNSRLGTISAPASDGHQYIKMIIILQDEPMSSKSMGTLEKIRTICHDYEKNQRYGEMPEVVATYGAGISALMLDMQQKSIEEFLKIDIIVIILILILLFFVMRSYLTPVRSVLTILMGVAWSLGLTALIFDNIMHIQVLWAIPILVFLICLGLGMDYDILLTTRIREYVGKGMDNDTAISKALEHSGAIITICGIIMGGAFLSLTLSSTPLLQQLGFAIGFTILVDALVIRTYIVPAVMHLMGRWNWVGPKFLQKHR